MRSLSYIPRKSTPVLLFNAAGVRLMSYSARVDSLPDTRVESATEEMNQIPDDIRDAKVIILWTAPMRHTRQRESAERALAQAKVLRWGVCAFRSAAVARSQEAGGREQNLRGQF